MAQPSNPNAALHDAACEVLQHCDGQQLKITVLNKVLFYSDLVALLEHGKTITGRPYIALKAGPVVGGYENRIVRDMARAGLAEQLVSEASDDKPMRLLRKADTSLPAEAKVIIKRVAQKLGSMSATAVSTYSHGNPGWEVAWAGGTGVGRPIDLNLALQQVAGDDAWLQEQLTEQERKAANLQGETRSW